jgi:hypothetical protein
VIVPSDPIYNRGSVSKSASKDNWIGYVN